MNLSASFSSVINNRPFHKAKEAQPDLVNIGKKWSHVEEDILLNRIGEGKSIDEISVEFKRTTGGIRGRLTEIACRLVLSGKSIDDVVQITTIDKTRINECLPAHRYKHERKVEKKTKTIAALPGTVKPQTDDLKELLTLTRDIHTMLKELLSEKNNKARPTIIKKVVKPSSVSYMFRDDN